MDNLSKTSNVSWKNIHDIHVAGVITTDHMGRSTKNRPNPKGQPRPPPSAYAPCPCHSAWGGRRNLNADCVTMLYVALCMCARSPQSQTPSQQDVAPSRAISCGTSRSRRTPSQEEMSRANPPRATSCRRSPLTLLAKTVMLLVFALICVVVSSGHPFTVMRRIQGVYTVFDSCKHGACVMAHASYVTRLMSQVSCRLPRVSCLMPHVTRLMSLASCLVSHASWLMSHATCLVSSCVMSHVSCLMAHVACLMSHASCLVSHAYCVMSHAS